MSHSSIFRYSYSKNTKCDTHNTKFVIPNGEVEGGLSKWSNESNPDRFRSVRSLCAVALLPCLLACFADCLAIISAKVEIHFQNYTNG